MRMMLDDDEDDTVQHSSLNTEENQILETMKLNKDPIAQFLRKVPPNFDKAELHGVSYHLRINITES